MRYSGLALQFIAKNFLYLIALIVVPAILLSFYYVDSSFSILLKTIFFELNPQEKFNFNLYFYFSLISNQNWYYTIGCLILIFFTITLVFAYSYRTMRIGAKSLTKPFRRINETLIPVFLVAVTLLLIFQIFALFATVFVNLLLLTKNPLLYRLLIPGSLIILYSFFLIIFLFFFMCAPTMLVTGYKFKEAISYSIKLTKGRLFKLIFAVLAPLIIIMLINIGLSLLTDAAWVRVVSGFFFTSFVLMYYPCLMMTTYYDIEGMRRNDIKRKPIYY